MDVSKYYDLAKIFSGKLNNSQYTNIAEEINRLLDNEDEDSPRIWIPKVNNLIYKIYSNEMNSDFSNELLELIQAELKFDMIRSKKINWIPLIIALISGFILGVKIV